MSEWRQKRFSALTTEQQEAKLKADTEYEIAVQNLYADKTLTVEERQNTKAKLYAAYSTLSRASGWEEEVTDVMLLAEAEAVLSNQTAIVNALRTKLGKATIEIAEKISEEVTKEVT